MLSCRRRSRVQDALDYIDNILEIIGAVSDHLSTTTASQTHCEKFLNKLMSYLHFQLHRRLHQVEEESLPGCPSARTL